MAADERAKVNGRAGQVLERARALYGGLDAVAARFEFERAPEPSETAGPPLVLLLGNHSSGKSTLVNFLLGEHVQMTGLAPTDDGFTVIAHGPGREEKDGATVVSSPDLSFGGLERFGPELRRRLKMKTHPHALLASLSLVDSPGMIDAPLPAAGGGPPGARAAGPAATADPSGRGYDFTSVCRWFAERADVIVLMFDPDKPGTTGETLTVLSDSLLGFDHKLLIVLNKVDRFRDIHDFARTYGALCWNLSKVIPRKDIPHIYNIYLPVPEREKGNVNGLPLEAFDRARNGVVEEIKRAPLRRIDNIVSRLYEYARRLRVHALVCERARRTVARDRARMAGIVLGLLALTAAVAFLVQALGGSAAPLAVVAAAGAAAAGGAFIYLRTDLHRRAGRTLEDLDGAFERAFERDLLRGDAAADLRALWRSVRDRTRAAAAILGPGGLPRLRRGEIRAIERAIEVEIPALRAAQAEAG